ncbi:MAG: PKD domain-containing protein, partial [Chitinophagales bacterium]
TQLSSSGGNSYVWSPTTGLSNSNISNPKASPNTTTTYTLTVTDINGCENTETITITVNPLPNVNAGNDLNLCNSGGTITETLAGYSPNTGGTGVWTGIGVSTSGVYTPNTIGTFVLTYTFTDIYSCLNSDSISVSVINPTISEAGIDFSTCLNSDSIHLTTQQLPTPSGGYWYGNGVNNNNFVPANAGVGNHILYYSAGTGTCLSIDSITVSVNALPIISITNDSNICIKDSITLNVSGGNEYVWTPDINISNDSSSNIIAFPNITTTYVVMATDMNTCVNFDSVQITVNQLPIVEAGSDLTVCNQPINDTLIGFSPTTGGTGIWTGNNVSNDGIFTPNGIGNFTLTYTFTDLNTCVDNDTMQVSVIDPALVNAGSDFSVCISEDSINLFSNQNPSPLGGIWSGNGVSNPTFNPSVLSAGNHEIFYSSGSGTCLVIDTIIVTVDPLPTIIVSTATEICIGDSVQISANGGLEYYWSPTTNINNVSISNPIVFPNISTNYVVTVTDLNLCINTDSVFVKVNALPIVNAGLDITLCNQPIQEILTGYSPELNQNGVGVWSGTNVSMNGVFTPNGIGLFPLEYLFTDTNTCVNTDSIIVEVIAPTIADAGPDLTACDNDSNVVISNFTPLTGGTWSGFAVDTSGVFNPILSGAGVFDLAYCVGSGTCLNCDTMQFSVLPSPSVNFDFNETCIGDSTFFVDLTTPNATSITNWSWNFGDGINTSTLQNPNNFYTVVDTFNVSLQIQSSNTCIDDTSINVVIHPLPSPAFTHQLLACPDSIIQFTLDTIDGTIYTWHFGDGNTGTGVNPTNIYTNSGIYTINLTAESAFGCIDSFSSQIEIALSPDANFYINPSEDCGPLSVVINYAPANPSLDFDFIWNFGNGDPFITNAIPPNPYIYNPTINGKDTFYIIELFVQSPICQQIDIHRDTVFVKSEPLTQMETDINAGCSPLLVNFSNNNYNNVDSIIVYFEDGSIEGFQGTADFSHTFLNLSAIDITENVLIISINECGIDTQEIPITIYPNSVEADLSSSTNGVCPNISFEIYNNAIGAAYVYYDLGYGNITANMLEASFNIFFPNSGNYTITQFVYSADSCSFDSKAIQIEVFENPVTEFDYTKTKVECSGDIEVAFENNTTNAVNYYWDFGDGDSSTIVNPVNLYPEDGTFSVLLISESIERCLDTLSKVISIAYAKNNLYVANAISPLLGIDEVSTFLPKATCLKTYKISIFNTWGELVWYSTKLENNTPSEAWRGEHIETGILLPQDVYIWEIDAVFENNEVWRGKTTGNGTKNIGTITLIK